MPDIPNWFNTAVTADELADAVGRNPKTVRYHCARGQLDAVQVAGRWFVHARYLDPAVYKAAVGNPGVKPKRR